MHTNGKTLISVYLLATPLLIGASLLVFATGLVWSFAVTLTWASLTMLAGFALLLGDRVPVYFLKLLGVVLTGYALMGKGFAYLGLPPLYIGEILFLLGLLALMRNGSLFHIFASSLGKLLILFVIWGAVCTLPNVGKYGTNAFRDAVVWGYAGFAVVLFTLSYRQSVIQRVIKGYRCFLPWFLVLAPVAFLIFRLAGEYLPRTPGSEVSILYSKPGDLAVHLGGAAAFLLLGLYRPLGTRAGVSKFVREQLLWLPWVFTAVMVCSISRSGLLAITCPILLVLLIRPSSRWGNLAAIGVLVVSTLLVLNLEPSLRHSGRTVSPQQLSRNVTSIFGLSGDPSLDGTRKWRLLWWDKIVDDTFFGEHFWFGKGYGVNLADLDGFQVASDYSLRSPHNIHLTFLARSGIPGFLLWTLVQLCFSVILIRGYLRSRKIGRKHLADLHLWILAYWGAFIVNGSFDVFLEGPQGGIWFWVIFGSGMALAEMSRDKDVAAGLERTVQTLTSKTSV